MMKKLLIIIIVPFFAGCSKQTILYPILKQDIYRINAGECGAETDGYFVSDFYMSEIMETTIK